MATTPVPEAAPVRVTSVQELLRKQGRATADGPGPTVDIGLTPQRDGVVFLGGTQEKVGLDRSLDPTVLATMALKAARLFPKLRDAAIVRAWCGFRPATADGHPLVGCIASHPRYVVASGHGGDGIALAPITGKYVAELIAESRPAPATFPAYALELLDRCGDA
jgi:sarcosine oxidase subunit beta